MGDPGRFDFHEDYQGLLNDHVERVGDLIRVPANYLHRHRLNAGSHGGFLRSKLPG